MTVSMLTLLPALITVLHIGKVQDSPETGRSIGAKKISTLEPMQVEQVLRKKKKYKGGDGTRPHVKQDDRTEEIVQ